ncbi:MAG: hypothetical protein ABJZ55_00715 [Fuerstiella sp.]
MIRNIESPQSEADHRRSINSVGSFAVKVYDDTADFARRGDDIDSEILSLGSDNIREIQIKQDASLLGHGNIDFISMNTRLKEMNHPAEPIIEGSLLEMISQTESAMHHSVFTNGSFSSE